MDAHNIHIVSKTAFSAERNTGHGLPNMVIFNRRTKKLLLAHLDDHQKQSFKEFKAFAIPFPMTGNRAIIFIDTWHAFAFQVPGDLRGNWRWINRYILRRHRNQFKMGKYGEALSLKLTLQFDRDPHYCECTPWNHKSFSSDYPTRNPSNILKVMIENGYIGH